MISFAVAYSEIRALRFRPARPFAETCRANRLSQLLSDFSTVDSGGSGRIIAVAAPGRMVEVNDGIAVPGDHRIVEGQRTDPLPALKLASLA